MPKNIGYPGSKPGGANTKGGSKRGLGKSSRTTNKGKGKPGGRRK